MAQGEVYGAYEFASKSYVRGQDLGRGAVGLGNVSPPLFLELRLIKSHTHTGIDSIKLPPESTPYMVRGASLGEREEKGKATWTGGASPAGSIILTYGSPFLAAPIVLATGADNNADIMIGVGTITTTNVTIYWQDINGATHTTLDINYLVKGR